MYYLAMNRGNFMQIQFGIYRHTLQIYYHALSITSYHNSLLLKDHIPGSQGS